MSKPSLTRYRTTNWSDFNAALRKRGSLSVWFDPEMVWHAGKTGKRGRPETFSVAAIQTCLTLKGTARLFWVDGEADAHDRSSGQFGRVGGPDVECILSCVAVGAGGDGVDGRWQLT